MSKNCVASIFLALSLLACIANGAKVFDITKYGANSKGDISQALLKAWKDATALSEPVTVVIPKGTWQLSQAKLVGSEAKCTTIHHKVEGTLQAPAGSLPDPQGEWVQINYVNNLEISGGGIFDGQGQKQAWKKNDYHLGSKSTVGKLPINLSLNFINNSHIHDVTVKNSKNFQVNCISSHNVTFKRFTVSAPEDSPNTDGLHVARSSNIHIVDSTFETGDDCISIGDESSEYHITNVKCGPGHGISIGSLGKNVEEKDVTGIYVKHCTFKGTQNGIRIKTWPSAPAKLVVSNVHFEDITMDNVSQPIIIDQEYCPWNQCNKNAPSLIQIKDVYVKNVRGTSANPEAVIFSCSGAKPCQGVEISDVDLKYTGKLGPTTTVCKNIKPRISGKNNPTICGGPAKNEQAAPSNKKESPKKEDDSAKKEKSPKKDDEL
jgi:galacturan 1,4-alpha-galacturonidase